MAELSRPRSLQNRNTTTRVRIAHKVQVTITGTIHATLKLNSRYKVVYIIENWRAIILKISPNVADEYFVNFLEWNFDLDAQAFHNL